MPTKKAQKQKKAVVDPMIEVAIDIRNAHELLRRAREAIDAEARKQAGRLSPRSEDEMMRQGRLAATWGATDVARDGVHHAFQFVERLVSRSIPQTDTTVAPDLLEGHVCCSHCIHAHIGSLHVCAEVATPADKARRQLRRWPDRSDDF